MHDIDMREWATYLRWSGYEHRPTSSLQYWQVARHLVRLARVLGRGTPRSAANARSAAAFLRARSPPRCCRWIKVTAAIYDAVGGHGNGGYRYTNGVSGLVPFWQRGGDVDQDPQGRMGLPPAQRWLIAPPPPHGGPTYLPPHPQMAKDSMQVLRPCPLSLLLATAETGARRCRQVMRDLPRLCTTVVETPSLLANNISVM
jgi:hypothetical protein